MNREDFGFWGIDLDADAFARALASAGVLAAAGVDIADGAAQAGERLRGVIDAAGPGNAIQWAKPDTPTGDAPRLAAAWEEARASSTSLRLEIDPGTPPGRWDPTWVIEQLARPAVGLASVFAAPPFATSPIARAAWHWPVDVALLPGDDSRALGEAIAQEGIPGEVVELFEADPARETCDLLLLPFDAREALLHLLRVPVRASCVVILGSAGEPWDRLRPMLETMSAHARSSAIVVASVPPDDRVGWFNTLMQELANDAGLDVALHRAGVVPPLLFAPDVLLRRTRMGAVLRELEQMAGAMPPEEAATAGAEISAIEREEEPTMAVPPPVDAPTVGGGPPIRRAERAARVGRSVRSHRPAPGPRF